MVSTPSRRSGLPDLKLLCMASAPTGPRRAHRRHRLESARTILRHRDLGAKRSGQVDARRIGRSLHDDLRAGPSRLRRMRHGNRVIARAHGRHARPQLFGVQTQDVRQGPSRLERTGALKELQLGVDTAAPRQDRPHLGARPLDDRCFNDVRSDQRERVFDCLQRDAMLVVAHRRGLYRREQASRTTQAAPRAGCGHRSEIPEFRPRNPGARSMKSRSLQTEIPEYRH